MLRLLPLPYDEKKNSMLPSAYRPCFTPLTLEATSRFETNRLMLPFVANE